MCEYITVIDHLLYIHITLCTVYLVSLDRYEFPECAAAKMIEEEELLSSARSLALSDANVPQLIRWPKAPLLPPLNLSNPPEIAPSDPLYAGCPLKNGHPSASQGSPLEILSNALGRVAGVGGLADPGCRGAPQSCGDAVRLRRGHWPPRGARRGAHGHAADARHVAAGAPGRALGKDLQHRLGPAMGRQHGDEE